MPPTRQTIERVYRRIKEVYSMEGRPVSYRDFPQYSKHYMRHVFSRLSRQGLIQRYRGMKTKPQFWVPAEGHVECHGGNRASSLLDLLMTLEWESPCMHDVRLRFNSPELCRLVYDAFNVLVLHGFKKRGDGSIESPPLKWGKNKWRKSRMVFYNSGTVIVEVAASEEPIRIEELVLRNFLENLMDLRRHVIEVLVAVYRSAALPVEEYLPLPESWTVIQSHLSRDANAREGLLLDKLAITLTEFVCTLRLYLHKRHMLRAEAIVTPCKSLSSFVKELLGIDMIHDREPSYIG